jgi:excisionase family DNA binding protein
MKPSAGISVADAAARLGVNSSRVRAMIQHGLLDAQKVGHRWLVDPASVERRSRSQVHSGGPLSAESAWAVILMKAGDSGSWLSPWGRSRAKRRLSGARIDDFGSQLGRRAELHRLRAHPSDLPRIAAEPGIVLGGLSAAAAHDINVSAPAVVEAYIHSKKLPPVLRRYRLQRSSDPNVLLHVVHGRWPFAPSERVVPAIVAAVDLLDADDPRSRRAGQELLRRLWIR